MEQRPFAEPTLPPILQRLLHRYWRFSRGVTLGVRAAALDADNRVFLVRHTYVPGWHLPGGGVEPGETALDALARELREEACLEVAGAPRLHGVYLNRNASDRDHVLLYVVRDFQPDRDRRGRLYGPHSLPRRINRPSAHELRQIDLERDPLREKNEERNDPQPSLTAGCSPWPAENRG